MTRADLTVARLLLGGADRREWWRLALTALGAALGTVFVLCAITVARIEADWNPQDAAAPGWARQYSSELLSDPGSRRGLVVAFLLLLVPVLTFVGQCARLGAARREQRFAALRLTGASPAQVHRIAAGETALVGGAGAIAGTGLFLAVRAVLDAANPGPLRPEYPPQAEGSFGMFGPAHGFKPLTYPTDVPFSWGWAVAAVLAVALLGGLTTRLALRRVSTAPLGTARRAPRRVPSPWILLLLPASAVAAVPLTALTRDSAKPPFAALLLCLVCFVVGLLTSTAVFSLVLGRFAARRGNSAALLLAGRRLEADPWAGARTHAALVLCTLVGAGTLGVRESVLEGLAAMNPGEEPDPYYGAAFGLALLALAVALAVGAGGLLVGWVESVTEQRRTLAAQVAAGVPASVLRRALLWQTALPLVPALVLAGVGSYGYLVPVSTGMYPLPLFGPAIAVAVAVAACLAATAAVFPLLRRSVHPAELRFE
ncbi:FtsX-like permease family protein [Streptomyces sp. HB2AG]|uniref:FtsX-like permease family protein n=1 Tax=Streptomyces sp. HB2AG TaxID=2983400 RepID=UPI0022AA6F05|nr:FtsX-like permease family protein [Streptomyces sp. HB2AG]MCZ2523251.1 ABC transporter permease [Streptomyces sp. HB2AG]